MKGKKEMRETIIHNEFTGYHKAIRHRGLYPALSTVQKHLRASKALDCQSVTTVSQLEGSRVVFLEIIDRGNGAELVAC